MLRSDNTIKNDSNWMEFHQKIAVLLDTRKPNNCDYAKNKFNAPSEIIPTHCVSRKEVPSPISNISQEEMQKLRKLVRIYCPFNFNHATKVKIKVELVSKELNHLAAILHVYAGGLNFMK